ncbi:MAG: 4Fe-4S dicluster domain-containing protein [Candidatus Bathyarchaeia archaeon]
MGEGDHRSKESLRVSMGPRLPMRPIVELPKYLNPDYRKCTGCRICEYACVKYHYGKVLNPELSRVRVYHIYPGPMAIPIQCSNCIDHPCTEACPVDPPVIYYDEKRFILRVDRERCLGHKCGRCAEVCRNERSGAIHFHPPEHDYAIVCDQCDGAGSDGAPDPQCAKICPTRVFFYSVSRGGSSRRWAWPPERIAHDLAEGYKPGTAERRVIPLPPELE